MFTPVKRLFKNTVFRLSMIAASLFAFSSLVVLGYIYVATVGVEIIKTDNELKRELDEIEALYLEKGGDYTNKEIIHRMRPGQSTMYVYYHNGDFTSNIEFKPELDQEPERGRPFQFVFKVAENNNTAEGAVNHRARARDRFIGKNGYILIARDVELIMATSERVTRSLLVSMLIALSLGLISGIYVSRRFARRIAAFNKLATDIRAGDLKRRAPRDDSGDELDDLAGHLNEMLDHIDRLMQAMRYAGDSIAHDLRSPLTRLQTRLESASVEVKDEASRETLLEASDDASQLLRTFEAVLRIARLETGERREMLVPLDPKPLIEDIAELYGPSCEDAGLGFTLNIEGKHLIRADRGLLSQAVSNLVENAIKYTPSGGHIALNLRKLKNGRSEISIEDTGPGIPKSERERVKERFVRLEESRTAPGSGLGLALVDAIADLHRGQFVLSDGAGDPKSKLPGLKASLLFPRVK
jgi:signal transduction histidine kinase